MLNSFTKIMLATVFIVNADPTYSETPVTYPGTTECFDSAADNKGDEAAIIKMMAEQRNIKDFVILNKKTGVLSLIKNCKVYIESPAIFGKTKGDFYKRDGKTTPAGIFELNDFQDNENISYLQDHDGARRDAYLLHPVLKGREKYLVSGRARESHISSGCINLPRPVLDRIIDFVRHSPHPKLVIMPEMSSVQDFFGLNKIKPHELARE